MNNYPFQAKLAAANDNWNINLTLNLTRAKNVVIFSLFKYSGELNYLFGPKRNDERKGFVALSPSYYPTIPLHNYRRKSHRSKMTTTDIIPISTVEMESRYKPVSSYQSSVLQPNQVVAPPLTTQIFWIDLFLENWRYQL